MHWYYLLFLKQYVYRLFNFIYHWSDVNKSQWKGKIFHM